MSSMTSDPSANGLELGLEGLTAPGAHLSDQELDPRHVAALAVDRARAIHAHLDSCESCRQRGKVLLEAREKAQREAYAHARKKEAEVVAQRKRKVAATTFHWQALLMGAAVAAVAWLAGVRGGVLSTPGRAPPTPTVTVRRAASGQLTVSTRGQGADYLLLYTRVAGGPWTPAWPKEGGRSGPLARRGATAPDLPGGAEEVLAVFSRAPLGMEETLRALGEGPAPAALPGETWVVQVPVGER